MSAVPCTGKDRLQQLSDLRASHEDHLSGLRQGDVLRRPLPGMRPQADGPLSEMPDRTIAHRRELHQLWKANEWGKEMSKLIEFTDNYKDNSTEAGFEFTFFCKVCNEGYKTRFIPSNAYKKKGLFQNIGRIAGAAGQLTGKYALGNAASVGSDVVSDRFQGMSPEWHKEHQAAMEESQHEAMGHFHRCPNCTNWVCDNDWNEIPSLCTSCAPRESVTVATARSQKMKEDIQAKASQTQVFTGEVDERQAVCPKCGKPSGQGKFCNNCG